MWNIMLAKNKYNRVKNKYNRGRGMRFTKSASWVFTGLMLAASGVYAQDDAQKASQPAGPEPQKSTQSDAREKPLRDAEALMKAGKPADAYNLLEPLEFDRSGEVRFDYLIGIAALDSGKPDKATLAFERVLAVDPNYAGARLDMARAYYQLGDLPRAKTEFETVAKQNPPEAARATIRKYLDAIAAQQAAKQTQFSVYVEGGVGYDSNVNNSTSQLQISVPYFNSTAFTLNPTNRKTADSYYSVATGGEISHNLNANWGLYAGADVRQRVNYTQSSFNMLNLDGRAGVAFTKDANIFRIGGLGGEYYLGSAVGSRYDVVKDYNRNSSGLSADWRHVYSPLDQISVFAQYGRNRFSKSFWDQQQHQYSDLSIDDFNQRVLGTGWLHALADGKSLLFGNVFLADEDDVAPITPTNPSGGRVDGNKRTQGLRAGGQTALREDTELFANFGLQSGVYDKVNTLFSRKRQDRLVDMSAGANWHWDKNWTLRPQLNYFRNDSNIVIYSYDRTDVSLTIRRDFR
jgi:tetratricopeptide (TPR) repeat protein